VQPRISQLPTKRMQALTEQGARVAAQARELSFFRVRSGSTHDALIPCK
jgi:hypothetical protein